MVTYPWALCNAQNIGAMTENVSEIGNPPLHNEANESRDGCGVAFEVTSRAVIAADPGERPFDNPSFGQDLEAGGSVSRPWCSRTAMLSA
jgi:hypothetical protein